MDVTRIDQMIAPGELFHHPVLLESMYHARSHPTRLGLITSLMDPGGSK